ncbi:family 2 encapsulin nanocompartment cargo protein polyprenyl transferase [Streptomyces sp. NBC_00237]|uniref:family 2 encapsulin nanocompartment cargo protein polyprenyl transferase n=1 Tax=Streptomyces sp. NBC_00237 TaxID=2975687 RepID=UPI002259F7E0|nr:family 2 encapsulin nanocompartment cargo protein polyprenyl transferase [Streptomyces sp. NBC_00237]MCX5204295.1 family 2 encapsulin nanocompartment cargo protein polyprenyl transferase [Streptomyces sp. NBC_00237]
MTTTRAADGDAGGSGGTAGPEGGAGPEGAAGLLARTKSAVDPRLRETVDSLPGQVRRIARYHFGWERADGTADRAHAGKAIRPALVLAAVHAFGGDTRQAERAAAAVELAHNFTLLHDDVIDEDPTRRNRPTAWTVFGIPDAIIAGDAMCALALRVLAEDPHPAAQQASARLAACIIELCEGQHADCAFENRAPQDVTIAECLTMAEAKTGALLGCACAIGALYAGAGEAEVEAMDAFGREAGLAFQLIDDLIGIWGDPAHTGKPAGADLAAHKKSLPVVAAMASGSPAAAELAELYRGPAMDATAVRRAADAVERAGGRDWAQSQAADRMARAVQHLSRAVPDLGAADDLLALAEFVTRRTR